MVMGMLTDRVVTVLWMPVTTIASPTVTVTIRDIEMPHRVMMVDIPSDSENGKAGLFSGFLSLFGAFLTITALVIIAQSVAYELRDVAKLMVKASG
jgi:VIT1/CCC1 family predicted Fe2+/Mn2+ transporter